MSVHTCYLCVRSEQRPRKKAKKPPLPHGPAGPLSAQICRAAPNSLRYAPFRQGARIQLLKSLRDARQILRASPMQKGDSKEHGSLRVASNGAALRACTSQIGDLRVRFCL